MSILKILERAQIPEKVEQIKVPPSHFISLAHKSSNVKGIWWYNLESGEMLWSDKPTDTHSKAQIFKDIAFKPGWLRGRVFKYQGDNVLIIYLGHEKLSGDALADIIDKVNMKLEEPIKYAVDDRGLDISNLLESLNPEVQAKFNIGKI